MRYCFHLHTTFSADGRISLDQLHEVARREGAQGLIITDHNTLDGALRFRDRFPDMPVIPGEEIMTRDGEIVGLFLNHTIARGLSIEETLRRIREQDGLVCIPHPFDHRRPSSIRPETLVRLQKEPDLLVEVFNGRTWGRYPDKRAETWARDSGAIALWGSDAHFPEEIGNVQFEIDPFDGPADFLKNMRRAKLLRATKTRLVQRACIRAKRLWGVYGPLRLPERIYLLLQSGAFFAVGGDFVSLPEVETMCQIVARQVLESGFKPDRVISILNSGFFPARRIADILGVAVLDIRVGHEQLRLGGMDTDDMIGALFFRNFLMRSHTRAFGAAPNPCRGEKLLLVDDDCTTGSTLATARSLFPEAGEVRTAVLRKLGHVQVSLDFLAEDRSDSRFRHPRFPWIKYSPHYPAYWHAIRTW